MSNLLILHGGGPTAVMNASLYGAIEEALHTPGIRKIYAAIGGSGGLMREALLDLREIPAKTLALLPVSPGSAIGSSRDRLREDEYCRMVEVIRKYEIDRILLNGGNGTMDTCGKLCAACKKARLDVKIIGIPKTMDNDLACTDHAPGYGSAARYIAMSTRELAMDVRSLPIHAVILETSGRNAGWVAAASALARENGGYGPDRYGPDLIYLPERPFSEEQFLSDTERLLTQKKGIVIVASEGLTDEKGEPVAKPVLTSGRDVYFGDVGGYLAGLITEKLHYKSRAEKPGLLGRASISLQSPVDREEAALAGRAACRAVLSGETEKMIALHREEGTRYQITPVLVPIQEVMMHERKLPDTFIHSNGHDVTDAFIQWAKPLIGPPLPEMVSLRNDLL